jgi:cell division septum initiation protein DivIVA
LSQAVAAARSAAEEKLAEAEATAMQWVAAAEAEAERVAQAHIVAANQSAKQAPSFAELEPPRVDEFVDEKPTDDGAAETSAEVSDGTGGPVPPTKKRVIRRS